MTSVLASAASAAFAADPFTILPTFDSQAAFSCSDFTASGPSNVVDSLGSSGGGVSGYLAHVVSNGNVVLSGTTTVYGNVVAGPGMTVGLSGGAVVLGTSSVNSSPVDCAPVDLGALAAAVQSANDDSKIPATAHGKSALGGKSGIDFSIGSGDSLTLPAGTYYFTSFTVSGGSSVAIDGPVNILCTGKVSIGGGSQINGSGNPYAVRFWCSGGTLALSNSNTVLSGFVYAPVAKVGISGGSRLIGGVFGGAVTISGGSRITRSVDQSTPLVISFIEQGAPLADGQTFNRDVAPTVVLSGGNLPSLTSLTLNGAAIPAGSVISAEGTYVLVATADDSVGRHVVASVTFAIDKTPPMLGNFNPPTGALLGYRQITLTGSCADAVSVSVKGAPALVAGGSFSATVALAEGANSVPISATDRAGNVSSASIAWVVDSISPIVSITSPSAGYVTKATTIAVSGLVADASAVTVTVNGVPAAAGNGAFNAPSIGLSEGPNTILAVAVDAAGHSGASAPLLVSRDTQPPVVDVVDGTVSITAGALLNHAVTPLIVASDSHLDSISATLNGAPFTSGTPILGDGNYDLVVVAADTVGNSTRKEVRFTIDTTPPTIAIVSPTAGSFLTNSSTTVSGTCGDAVSVSVNGAPATVSGGEFHLDGLVLPEGLEAITATATDAAGNTSVPVSVSVTVDTIAPIVTIVYPADRGYIARVPFTVNGSATDANLVSVSVNGGAAERGADGSFSSSPLSPPDGPFSVTVVAIDAAGHSGSATASVTIDTTLPRIAVTNGGAPLSDGGLFNKPVTPVVTIDDANPGSSDVRLNGASFVTGTPISADGAYRLDVTARDAAGNVASSSIGFTIDTQPPRIGSLVPSSGAVLRETAVTVSGSCDDAVAVTVNGAAASVASGTFSIANVPLVKGSNELSIVARDAAGNSSEAALTLVLDNDPPVVTLTSPVSGLVTKSATVAVTGTAVDDHLVSVAVNNGPAALSGSSFSRAGVPLVEGANVIDAVATDAAGNTGEAKATVNLDTTAPTLVITSPVSGAIAGVSTIDVSGTVSDPHLQGVSVNGVGASFSGGHFTAAGIALVAGANTLTATATDTVGNSATASVTISYDDRAPNVVISAPADGARMNRQPVAVSGTVEGGTGITLTVNGVAAIVSGSSFAASGIPLNEGANTLTARATNDAGKQGVATASVTFDDVAPAIASVSPADGSWDVPLATVVRVVFSEPIDPASPASFSVVADGVGPIAGKWTLDSVTATFVPDAALPEKSAFAVTIPATAVDLAGNTLGAPFVSHFHSGSAAAPAAPSLDPLPKALCAPSITLSGTTDPFLRVSVTGGAALASATADVAGRFAIDVVLTANSRNVLSVIATDSRNRTSSPSTATVVSDCIAPEVSDARISGSGLVITFSESIDPETVAAGSGISLAGASGDLAQSISWSSAGSIATITGNTDLSKVRFTLTVSTAVKDAAGNGLATPFTKTFSPGSSAILGEVYDDRIGRPLSGATITLLSVNGTPPAGDAPVSSSESDGRFALDVPSGDLTIAIARPGYASVYRHEVAEPDSAVTTFDARLTALVLSASDPAGGGQGTDGGLSLSLAPGTLGPAAPFSFAGLSPQGLPMLLPLGWSSIAAADLEMAGAALARPARATWKNAGWPAGSEAVLVHFDPASDRWIVVDPAVPLSIDAASWSADLGGEGVWALVAPDPDPFTPPDAIAGQPLLGVAAPAADPLLSANVSPDPPAVLPPQTDIVTVTLTSSAPVPSGYPIQALISEQLTRLDGVVEVVPDFLSDFVVQRSPAGEQRFAFSIRPSAEATRVALSVGFEEIAVKHYPFEIRRGDLLPASGGTVSGAGGFSITVPDGAVSEAVPVTLSPLSSPGDLPIGVPAGYHLVSALRLGLGEVALARPAVLRFTPTDGSALSASAQYVWIEAATLGDGVIPRFVARGDYDATSGSVATMALDPDLVVPGVREDGVYLLLSADAPIAFASGRVLDVDGRSLPGALISEQGTTIVQISDGSGAYALPLPAAGSTLFSSRPETGNSGSAAAPASSAGAVVAVDIDLAITAPYVTSLDPAPGPPLPLTATVVVTFSEPVDPLSIGPSSVTLFYGSSPIDGTVTLSPSGTQVVFAPSAPLPSNVDLTLRVSSTVKDRTGYGLVDPATKQPADFVATYHTFDDTPPAGIDPLLIYVGMPAGTPPTATITGGPGSVCGGCTVTAVDDTTQATASTTADGSGAFRVDLVASASDSIYLVVAKSNGTQIRINPGPFRDDGGRTAIVGTAAEDYVSADRIRVTFPDGTFGGPTTVRVTSVAAAQAPAPIPGDAAFVAGFQLDTGGVRANNAIDFGVPAPAGAPPGDQFVAAVPVSVLGQTYYMVLDTARLDGAEVTTRPVSSTQSASLQLSAQAKREAKNVLQFRIRPQDAASPAPSGDPKLSLPRISESSTVIILELQRAYDFIAGLTGDPSAIVMANTTPYVWFTPRAYEKNFFLLPVPQGEDYQLSILDSVTGFTRFQGNFSGPTDPVNVTRLPDGATAGSDNEPPRLVDAAPAAVSTFTPLPTSASPAPLTPSVTYTFVADPSGTSFTLKVTGAPGAVAPGARVTLADNARNSAIAPVSASADGSFTLTLPSAQNNDDFTLVLGDANVEPGASVHLEFSEPLGPSQDLSSVIVLTTSGATAKLAATIVPDPDLRGVTIFPQSDFARGTSYAVTLLAAGSTAGLKDEAGNAIRSDVVIPLDSPRLDAAGKQATTDVNDLAQTGGLLFEVTQGGTLGLFSAADPAALSPCSSVDFAGAALRGVAYDGYGRAVVSGGGGAAAGFVSVHRLVAASNPCGYALSLNPLSRTLVASAIGDNASPLPDGFPRRVRLVSDDTVRTFTVDGGAPPSGIAVGETNDPANPGKQKASSPLSVTVLVGAGLRNHPVKATDKATGESKIAYTDDSGSVTLILTASSGDGIEVRSNASLLAIVANQGFGIDVVDVNATDLSGAQAVLPESQRLLVEFDGTYASPVGQYCGSDSVCPSGFVCHGDLADIDDNYCYVPFCQERDGYGNCIQSLSGLFDLTDLDVVRTDDGKFHVLTGINHFGLASWALDPADASHPFHYESQLRIGSALVGDQLLSLATATHLKLKPASERTNCRSGQIGDTPTLAFVAEGTAGFYVVDVSDPTKLSVQNVIAHYDTDGQTARFGVDTLHDLLYVADGGQGVKVYDVSDPCTSGTAGLADPRLLGTIATGGNANVPFVVDPETGVAFGAAQNTSVTSSTVFTFSLFPPPVSFVADTDRNGVWEEVTSAIPLGIPNAGKKAALAAGGAHAPYPADTVRLYANLAGGAGQDVTVEIDSATPAGFHLPPAPPGFPKATNVVRLRRQSDDAADPGFNRYLSPPIVLLADPRAQAQYAAAAVETDESNPYACANCAPAVDYAGELVSLSAGPTSGTSDAPASAAVEQMTGDLLVARLDTGQTDSGPLAARLKYLSEANVEGAVASVSTVRMDWTPGLRQAPRVNPSESTDETGSAVVLSSGEVTYPARDLFIAGRGLDFSMSRFYASQGVAVGPLGQSWDSPLFARLRTLPDGSVDYFDGTGRRETFAWNAASRQFTPPAGRFAELYRRPDGTFLLLERDKSTAQFDTEGRLTEWSDPVRTVTSEANPDGNRIVFSRDSEGRLVGIRDALGHPIALDYYPDTAARGDGGAYPGLLHRIVDHTDREVLYKYDDRARLVEVDLPDVTANGTGAPFAGSTRRKLAYAYATPSGASLRPTLVESKNVVSIVNARGQEILHLDFGDGGLGAADVVTRRSVAGVPESFAYDFRAHAATVIDRRGHQWSYTHDPDGHATSVTLTANDTADAHGTGPYAALTVPSGIVSAIPLMTQLSYASEDGLSRSITLPSGTTESYDYASPGSLDRRQRANLVADTVAGAGQSIKDQFAYNTYVNEIVSHTDATNATTTFTRDPKKGFVTDVAGPPSIGLDSQNPPTPGTGFGVDATTGLPLSESDRGGVGQLMAYFSDPSSAAFGYLQKITQTAVGATPYVPLNPSVTTFVRDARGNAVSVTDARGVTSTSTVNEADQIVQTISAAASTDPSVPALSIPHTFEYDADGNVVKESWVQSPLGVVTKIYARDALGRVTAITEGGLSAPAATTRYVYDSAGNPIATISPAGDADVRVYDARNLIVGEQRIGPDGLASAMHTWKRDGDGRVVEDFDGVNTKTVVSYDGIGRPAKITTPRGAEIAMEYDGVGRPTHMTLRYPGGDGPIWKERSIEYAANGQVVRDVEKLRSVPGSSPTDVVRQFFYDVSGRLAQSKDPLGRTTIRNYDDHGRLAKLQDPAGNVFSVDFDLAGNPVARHSLEIRLDGTFEPERVEHSVLDALGRTVKSGDALEHYTIFSYDEVGNLLSRTDPLSHQETYGWDERGRRLSVVDAIGNKAGGKPSDHRTSFAYDDDSRLLSLTDAEARQTSYHYDSIGRLVETDYPDAAAERKTWNGDGTIATATDPLGSVATFTYGPDDQPENVSYHRAPGVSGVTSESFSYDPLGRLVSATSDGGVGGAAHTTARAWDSLDRLLSETEDGKVLSHSYDAVGNRLSTTYPGSSRTFSRTYDPLDRLASVNEILDPQTQTKRLIRSFQYAGIHGPAVETAPGNIQTTYTYDTARRLTQLVSTNLTTQSDLVKFVYAWADDDVPLYEQRLHEGGRGDVFQNDEDHRLTLETLSQANPTGPPDPAAANKDQLFLGAVHERTGEIQTLAGVATTNPVALNPRYGYTTYGSDTSRAYDRAGSLSRDGHATYVWDARHRLIEADLSNGTKLEYGYDALGRRVEKRKTVSGASSTTNYLFDGWNAVQESIDGAISRETISAGPLDSSLEYRLTLTGKDYDLFRDGNGSTAAVLASDGTSQLFKYLPFGRASLLSGASGSYSFDLSSATDTSLWEGLDFDADLGWYYARNRWLDPTTGAFTSTDPLGYPDGPNGYVWGISSGRARDPQGLSGNEPAAFDRLFAVINAKQRSSEGSGIITDTLFGVWRTISHPIGAIVRARDCLREKFARRGAAFGSSLAPAAKFGLDSANLEAEASEGASGQAPVERLARLQNEFFRPIAIEGGRSAGRAAYDLGEALAVGGITKVAGNSWNEFEKLAASGETTEYSDFMSTLRINNVDPSGIRVVRGNGGKLAVIGRNMTVRVDPVASSLGGETFAASKAATEEWSRLMSRYAGRVPDPIARRSLMYGEDLAWTRKVKAKGYAILDLGGPSGSTFYDMEVREIHGR